MATNEDECLLDAAAVHLPGAAGPLVLMVPPGGRPSAQQADYSAEPHFQAYLEKIKQNNLPQTNDNAMTKLIWYLRRNHHLIRLLASKKKKKLKLDELQKKVCNAIEAYISRHKQFAPHNRRSYVVGKDGFLSTIRSSSGIASRQVAADSPDEAGAFHALVRCHHAGRGTPLHLSSEDTYAVAKLIYRNITHEVVNAFVSTCPGCQRGGGRKENRGYTNMGPCPVADLPMPRLVSSFEISEKETVVLVRKAFHLHSTKVSVTGESGEPMDTQGESRRETGRPEYKNGRGVRPDVPFYAQTVQQQQTWQHQMHHHHARYRVPQHQTFGGPMHPCHYPFQQGQFWRVPQQGQRQNPNPHFQPQFVPTQQQHFQPQFVPTQQQHFRPQFVPTQQQQQQQPYYRQHQHFTNFYGQTQQQQQPHPRQHQRHTQFHARNNHPTQQSFQHCGHGPGMAKRQSEQEHERTGKKRTVVAAQKAGPKKVIPKPCAGEKRNATTSNREEIDLINTDSSFDQENLSGDEEENLSDDEDVILPWKGEGTTYRLRGVQGCKENKGDEPLRVGDIIEYDPPIAVAGSVPREVAQVYEVSPESQISVLHLSTGVVIENVACIRRVGEYKGEGNVQEHNGRKRQLHMYGMSKSKLPDKHKLQSLKQWEAKVKEGKRFQNEIANDQQRWGAPFVEGQFQASVNGGGSNVGSVEEVQDASTTLESADNFPRRNEAPANANQKQLETSGDDKRQVSTGDADNNAKLVSESESATPTDELANKTSETVGAAHAEQRMTEEEKAETEDSIQKEPAEDTDQKKNQDADSNQDKSASFPECGVMDLPVLEGHPAMQLMEEIRNVSNTAQEGISLFAGDATRDIREVRESAKDALQGMKRQPDGEISTIAISKQRLDASHWDVVRSEYSNPHQGKRSQFYKKSAAIAAAEMEMHCARPINGQRVEIFYGNTAYGKDCFYWILSMCPSVESYEGGIAQGERILLDYFQQQLCEVPVFVNLFMTNNALLVSWGSVPAQNRHIDLREGHFQGITSFGKYKPTVCYEPKDGSEDCSPLNAAKWILQSVTEHASRKKRHKQLAAFASLVVPASETDERKAMEEEMAQLLSENEFIKGLLAGFGKVLIPLSGLARINEHVKHVSCGETRVARGSLVHNGSASNDTMRMMSFFALSPAKPRDDNPHQKIQPKRTGGSATTTLPENPLMATERIPGARGMPKVKYREQDYNPNIQYSQGTLLHEIASNCWDDAGLKVRLALLISIVFNEALVYHKNNWQPHPNPLEANLIGKTKFTWWLEECVRARGNNLALYRILYDLKWLAAFKTIFDDCDHPTWSQSLESHQQYLEKVDKSRPSRCRYDEAKHLEYKGPTFI